VAYFVKCKYTYAWNKRTFHQQIA